MTVLAFLPKHNRNTNGSAGNNAALNANNPELHNQGAAVDSGVA
jgi:hypothetical protein